MFIKKPGTSAGFNYIKYYNSNKGTSFNYAPPPIITICIHRFHCKCKYENKKLNKKTYFV